MQTTRSNHKRRQKSCPRSHVTVPLYQVTKTALCHNWNDIVLPPDKRGQLREICSHFKLSATVYESWGFNKHGNSKGASILFSGPSGTGKTLAAETIAGELGLDMYEIDCSKVVSKYIGETEKKIDENL